MKKNSRRKHRSEGDKYYIPFLPDEVFNSLPPELKEIQRQYRVYHHTVHNIKKRIKDNTELRKQLLEKIKDDKIRLKERANDEYQDRGYEELMKFRFQKIAHLYDDYRFTVSISRINRSSKSYHENKSDMEKLGFINSKEGDYRKFTYGGKDIGEVYTFNAQIKSLSFPHSKIQGLSDGKNNKIKTISLGTEEVMRKNISLIFGEDLSEDNWDDIKADWIKVLKHFINWYLTKHDWKSLKLETISKDKVVEWCLKMGSDKIDSEFDNWYPKEG